MKRLLASIEKHAVTWALAVLFVAVWLFLNATLDGPSETDAARATALAVMDAIVAEEAQP
jgi:hypothetical protein